MINLLTNSCNRILSLIVVAAIILSVAPITAAARDNDTGTGTPGTSGCVCEALCGEDSINADCPVCGVDYEQCAYTGVPTASPGNTGNEDGSGLKLAPADACRGRNRDRKRYGGHDSRPCGGRLGDGNRRHCG